METFELKAVGVEPEVIGGGEGVLVELFFGTSVCLSSFRRQNLDNHVGIFALFFPNDPTFAGFAIGSQDYKEIRTKDRLGLTAISLNQPIFQKFLRLALMGTVINRKVAKGVENRYN